MIKSAFHHSLRQRGVAIIAVLMVAALVASVAGLLMLRQQRALQQLDIRKDTADARAATWSVLQLVRLTLRDDARLGQPDHLLKPWAMPIPEIKIENGAMSGRLIELQGRFNVNNLLDKDSQLDTAAMAAYRQLLLNMGLSASLADSLQRYLVQHAVKQGDKVLLQPLLDLNELSTVDGYDAATLRSLETYVVALPVATTINVNFVSPEVLAAWLPSLGVSGAEQVLAKRRSKYFTSVDEFIAAVPTEMQAGVPLHRFSVKSSFFWAEMGARFGVVFLQHRALLDRSKSELPNVLWIRRIY